MSSSDEETLLRYFHQIPERSPCYAAIVLYSLGSLICLFLTIRSKAWFMLVVTAAAWLEVIGFGLRLGCIYNPIFGLFAASQALLIIAPVLLPLVNYVALGQLIKLGDASRLPVRPVSVALFFIAANLFCLPFQAAGCGMITDTDSKTRRIGTGLLLAGLFIQLVIFGCFTLLTLWLQRSRGSGPHLQDLGRAYICLYSTIVLISTRHVFRVVEFIQGYDGYLASHELFFYAFDFALICTTVFLYCVFHFGDTIPKSPEDAVTVPVAPVEPKPQEQEVAKDEEDKEATGERSNAPDQAAPVPQPEPAPAPAPPPPPPPPPPPSSHPHAVPSEDAPPKPAPVPRKPAPSVLLRSPSGVYDGPRPSGALANYPWASAGGGPYLAYGYGASGWPDRGGTLNSPPPPAPHTVWYAPSGRSWRAYLTETGQPVRVVELSRRFPPGPASMAPKGLSVQFFDNPLSEESAGGVASGREGQYGGSVWNPMWRRRTNPWPGYVRPYPAQLGITG